MPHVEIKCYPGRTEEQKKICAAKIAEDIAQTLGCEIKSVSVAIKEVRQEDWKKAVWDAQIVADRGFLYKEPGYTCD
ncbi:MAG: tautomerase family protein [Lachnospiraceae bacterium]|nr:tautomerase family protein [Lachnospiraceae bacterium]MCR5086845.1 tautomerase family protein [Lachnospiraceae bacterium]